MKRLTISTDACTETLALLITMAWADGKLEDREKEGVRAASEVLNLTKELRARLDQLVEKPMELDELLFDELSPRDKAFAFVAAAWMTGVDEDVDAKEEEMLAKLSSILEFTTERQAELRQIARDLEPLRKDGQSWADEVIGLFRAIPQRLEGDGSETFEVAFE